MDYSNGTMLYWESSYEIVQTLMSQYPNVDIDSVGTEQLRTWIIELPNFMDDPFLANEEILLSILREWYEETISYG